MKGVKGFESMSTGNLIQFILDVLSLGSLYALMALGLVIIYGILKLVNFAYGELVMVAGYTLYLLNATPFPWLAMAVVAILVAIATGILTEFIAFKPVRPNLSLPFSLRLLRLARFCKIQHYSSSHRAHAMFRYRIFLHDRLRF